MPGACRRRASRSSAPRCSRRKKRGNLSMMQELMEGGVRHFAVQVGDTARGRALTRILALKTSPGWHVKGNEIREWRFEGLAEKEGAPLLYGPHVAGRQLAAILDLPLPGALAFLSRLVQALRLLVERR